MHHPMLSSQVVLNSSRIRETRQSERGALVIYGPLFFFFFLLSFIYFWFNYLSNDYQLVLILFWLAMLHSSSLEVVFLRNYNIPIMMMMKMLISICPIGRMRFRVSRFMSGYPL